MKSCGRLEIFLKSFFAVAVGGASCYFLRGITSESIPTWKARGRSN